MLRRRLTIFPVLIAFFILTACGGGSSSSSGGSGGSGGNNLPPSGGSGGACSAPPVTQLQVLQTTPANGQQNVYTGTKVSVRFNTCIDMASVNGSSFIMFGASGMVAGSFAFNASDYTLIFTPAGSLAMGMYSVTVTTAVKSLDGKSLAADYPFGFIVQNTVDATAPVTTATPAGGHYQTARQVALNCDDGTSGSGCAHTYYTLDGAVPTTASSPYSTALTIDADTTLRFFSTDFAGNSEAVRTEQYFIDTTPPEVTGKNPAAGATGVVLTSAITTTFSESIDTASLDTATMTVDQGVTGAITYDDQTHTATFVPAERLACNTDHTVTLTTGIRDLAGNGLAADVSWTFRTHDDCSEPVTSATVDSGAYTSGQSVTLNCTDSGGSGCRQIAYTTDGSMPSFDPPNGTVVSGAVAGPITIGQGDTLLRFCARDFAGNREVLRERNYAVSANGFLYVATVGGLARGAGPTPSHFRNITSQGETLSFFFDSSNNRFYRGTEYGLAYSDDGGLTWGLIPIISSYGYYCQGNSIDARGSRIYVATENGLFASTDGGVSFERRAPVGAAYTDWITDVHASGNIVYAGTVDGFSVSTDKGHSFVNRTTADGLGNNHVNDIEVGASTIYAATNGGLSISVDGGATFVNRTTADGLADNFVHTVAVSGSTVFAGTAAGLSISVDGGNTFSITRTTADGLGDNGVSAIDLSRLSENILYVGSTSATGDNAFSISFDGGVSFTHYPVYYFPGLDVEVNSLFVKDGLLYVGAHPTYYVTADDGATFKVKGLPTPSFSKIATDDTGTLYVAVEDSSGSGGVAVSSDSGFTFDFRDPTDGLGDDRVDDLYVDGTTIYAATSGGLSISSDGGRSWTNHTESDGLSNFFTDSVFASGTTVYAGTGGWALDRSTDGGQNFANLAVGLGSVNALYAAGANIYAATGQGFWLSTDNGATFTNTVVGDEFTTLLDIEVSGATVYAGAMNDGLFVSTDSGQTFAQNLALSNGGLMSVNSIHLIGGDLYLATSDGVAYSNDAGASFTWYTTQDGLGSDRVADVCYVP